MKGSLIPCSLCGSLGTVVDVRLGKRQDKMQVRRRYECRQDDCSHRWSTVETLEEFLPRGMPGPLDLASPEVRAMVERLSISRLQQLVYKLRKGREV